MWLFSEITGNEAVKNALRGMVDSGRIPQALMLYENDGGGAFPLAMAFLQYLNCPSGADGRPCCKCPSCSQHADLVYPDEHFSFPVTSGSKVSADAKTLNCAMFSEYWRKLVLDNPYFMESDLSAALGFEKKRGRILKAEGTAILRQLSLSPFSDGYRAVIMYLPELMNGDTANMLLKAIEEPAEKDLFILITHAPEKVLPTISSRCQSMRVLPLSREEVSEELCKRFSVRKEDADAAAMLSGGSVGLALRELSAREDVALIRDLLRRLFTALLSRDLYSSLDISGEVADLDSREKQKLFCNFAGELLRNVFLIQNGMDGIVAAQPEEMPFLRDVASRCKPDFCRKALDVFCKTSVMIDRNVSQKIAFTNLTDRLYMII